MFKFVLAAIFIASTSHVSAIILPPNGPLPRPRIGIPLRPDFQVPPVFRDRPILNREVDERALPSGTGLPRPHIPIPIHRGPVINIPKPKQGPGLPYIPTPIFKQPVIARDVDEHSELEARGHGLPPRLLAAPLPNVPLWKQHIAIARELKARDEELEARFFHEILNKVKSKLGGVGARDLDERDELDARFFPELNKKLTDNIGAAFFHHHARELNARGELEARFFHELFNKIKTSFGGVAARELNERASRPAKVDKDKNVVAPPRLSADVSRAITSARQAAGLSQKELAQKTNVTPSTIQDLESGRGTPNPQVLAMIERVLKIRLRGSDIGKSL
ncbi:hypothetical protein HGRIS_002071 [Hohenbuehelia grisea]|uniref:HTH cro/C1-type domain-containing protein n=1 Tax=Hohenbuehelia grisea TaxID=104357 RepID=A0ABR3JJJ4_9AGAR